jgi:hypothetical protein
VKERSTPGEPAVWGRGRAVGDGRIHCRLPDNIRVGAISAPHSPAGHPSAPWQLTPPSADRRCDIFPGDTAITLTWPARWTGRTAPGHATGRHRHRQPPVSVVRRADQPVLFTELDLPGRFLLSTSSSGWPWSTTGCATWFGIGTTSSCLPSRCSGHAAPQLIPLLSVLNCDSHVPITADITDHR